MHAQLPFAQAKLTSSSPQPADPHNASQTSHAIEARACSVNIAVDIWLHVVVAGQFGSTQPGSILGRRGIRKAAVFAKRCAPPARTAMELVGCMADDRAEAM
jgi:hypothetical protein